MEDTAARLNVLKTQIDQGKTEKARAEANLETFTNQRQELIKELNQLGVTPENLDAEIAKLDRETEVNLSQAEALMEG